MKLLSSLLLVSAVIAIADAACSVCSCKKTPTVYTKAFSEENVKSPLGTTFYRDAKKVDIEGCLITLECDYQPDDENYQVGLFVENKLIPSLSNLQDVQCSNASWVYEGKPVDSIGCYSITYETDYP